MKLYDVVGSLYGADTPERAKDLAIWQDKQDGVYDPEWDYTPVEVEADELASRLMPNAWKDGEEGLLVLVGHEGEATHHGRTFGGTFIPFAEFVSEEVKASAE